MFVTLLVILGEQQASAGLRYACGVLNCGGVSAGKSWHTGTKQSGHGSS
jgi:hypothetical protein